MTIEQLIGKTSISEAAPVLKGIADKHDLKLNRAEDFKKAKRILSIKLNSIYRLISKD